MKILVRFSGLGLNGATVQPRAEEVGNVDHGNVCLMPDCSATANPRKRDPAMTMNVPFGPNGANGRNVLPLAEAERRTERGSAFYPNRAKKSTKVNVPMVTGNKKKSAMIR